MFRFSVSQCLHTQISPWSKKKPFLLQGVGTLDSFKGLEPAELWMLQSLVTRSAACIKTFSQSFFLPGNSPIQVHSVAPGLLLSLCLFPCISFSLAFLHLKEKLVSRCTPISFSSLCFLNLTFYSCSIPPIFFLFLRHKVSGNA